MHNHYIINEVVDFNPATSTLRSIHHPDVVVTLNSPAGRCLLLLIKKIGTVVTQHEFMEHVWKQSGMTVTPNTYYQNISVLRKGLKRIGLGEEIIVTLPRLGLTLATGTRIQKQAVEMVMQVSDEGSDVLDVLPLISEGRTDEVMIEKTALAGGETLPVVMPYREIGLNTHYLLKYALIFLTLMIAIGIIVTHIYKIKPGYFSEYAPVMSIKGCDVFLSPALSERSNEEIARRYGAKFTDDCQSYPWVYITKIPNLPRASVIRCDRSIENANACISDYFIE